MRKWNQRQKIRMSFIFTLVVLLMVVILGICFSEEAVRTDFSNQNLSPCIAHPFGTDWLGRDMLARTLRGLSLSILLGLLAAAVSTVLALGMGIAAALSGRTVEVGITFIIDLVMGVPHILLMILISLAFSGGMKGVIFAVALTHWPSLARLIRAEVISLRESAYIQIARRLGKSQLYIVRKHAMPQVLSQLITGLVLLFPHAILHEASITFLGFGLPTGQPAIGILLSEAMRYLLTGKWWLALFPGISLAIVVLLFYLAGENIRRLTAPASIHM